MTKLEKLLDFPTLSTYEEVEKFLYLTLYLKIFIPGRADHACVLKGVKGKFCWGPKQQASFDAIWDTMICNACAGNDHKKHHFLAVDVSTYEIAGVFFQLPAAEKAEICREETKGLNMPKGKEVIICYISRSFSNTKTRYTCLEREALAMLRAVEEV